MLRFGWNPIGYLSYPSLNAILLFSFNDVQVTRKEERLRTREELEAMDPLTTTDGDGKSCDAGLGWLEGDQEDGGDY